MVLPSYLSRDGLSYDDYSSATGRLIGAKDHAAVQINVAEVNSAGVITGDYKTFALSGFVRQNCESDDSFNRLATEAGLLKKYLLDHLRPLLTGINFYSVWSAQH